MIKGDYLLMVSAMGLVTYLPRSFPLVLLSKRTLPKWFVEWLDFIPAAVLSALLLPELILSGSPKQLNPAGPEMIIALPVFLIAMKTRSLGITVISGMALYYLAGLTG